MYLLILLLYFFLCTFVLDHPVYHTNLCLFYYGSCVHSFLTVHLFTRLALRQLFSIFHSVIYFLYLVSFSMPILLSPVSHPIFLFCFWLCTSIDKFAKSPSGREIVHLLMHNFYISNHVYIATFSNWTSIGCHSKFLLLSIHTLLHNSRIVRNRRVITLRVCRSCNRVSLGKRSWFDNRTENPKEPIFDR